MEIRRVLKPGGIFFATFLGPTPMADMLGEPYYGRGADFGMYVKGPFQNWNDGGPMIFVSPDWLKSFWGSIFDIDYIAIDGLMDYQSFLVARKAGHRGADQAPGAGAEAVDGATLRSRRDRPYPPAGRPRPVLTDRAMDSTSRQRPGSGGRGLDSCSATMSLKASR